MKKILRIGALLLIATMLFCGCDVKEENTKKSTKETTVKTTVTVATSKQNEDSNNKGEVEKKPEVVRKKVALTFDDGPDDINTKMLVDELNKYGFNATFFVIGKKIDNAQFDVGSVLNYVLDNGNEIGIHAYNHNVGYGDGCSEEDYQSEITKTADAVHTVLPDYEIKLMRPTYGQITADRIAKSDYSVINWSIDTYDWKYTGRATEDEKLDNIMTVVNTVISRIQEGDIVLMHEVHDNSLEAAVIILEWLYINGYEVVPVSELLGEDMKSGVRYYSAK